jgi:hypothetical protein
MGVVLLSDRNIALNVIWGALTTVAQIASAIIYFAAIA